MNDREIIDLFWQRSERAIAETDRKYGGYCRAVATNILTSPEDAEECVNDAWLSAWNAMPDKRPERLGAFLAKITRNHALTMGEGEAPDTLTIDDYDWDKQLVGELVFRRTD